MNNKISINNSFETKDLNLACVLLSLGYTLDSIDKREPQKSIFIFLRQDGDGLDEIIQSFWARALKLDPLSVLTSLKLLKNRLYSEEKPKESITK